mmetsp:Transcript_767/g.1612  ORF Transcript_767/g.1612 Transcript_767/m.1612 type:complete len:267 (-) Transcript_767:377-1177(-)
MKTTAHPLLLQRPSPSPSPSSPALQRKEAATNISRHLRLPLMSLREIMKVVRPSGLVDLNQLMEAVDYHSDPSASQASSSAMFQQRVSSTSASNDSQGPHVQCLHHAWRPDVRGPQITISNGGRTAYQASSNWNGVLGTTEMREGVHRVTVRIDSLVYMGNVWQAVFGVAHPSASASIVSEVAFKDIHGLVVGTGDVTVAGSVHAEPFTVPIKPGTSIYLVYDATKGSLEFFREGTSLGVACKQGLKPPLVAALAIASNCAFTLCD